MARVVYRTATTLTGHIADEYGSLEWLFAVDHTDDPNDADPLDGVTALVCGASTYLWVVEHEDLLARPEKWQRFYGDRPMVLFTHRELPVPAGADVRPVRGPVADVLADLRATAGGGDVRLLGGGDLVGQFADVGALDEVVLTVAPVALPAGAPVLPRRLESDRLTLTDVRRRGQFVELRYAVARPRPTTSAS